MRSFIIALYLILFSMAMLTLVGCAGNPYIEIGAGVNKSLANKVNEWDDGRSPAFLGEIGVEWELSDNWHPNCKYLHVSQWFAGPPFNDISESSLDHFGCAVKYRWVK